MNLAIVGYGGIAAFHAEALQAIPGTRLHAVVGRRAAPAEAFARQWQAARWGTDLAAVLADPALDGVIVASPSECHAAMALACIEAGKPALVEIPLALSAGLAQQVAEAARQRGVPVMVAHTRRFQPVQVFVHELLASGRLGRVHQHHTFSFWLRHENVGWTGYQRSWVDDVLFHHGCHLVDFSMWCVGRPVCRVLGELSPVDPRTGTSLDVSLLIRYAGDAIATVSLSYNARRAASGDRFICDGGLLELEGGQARLDGEVVFTAEGQGGLAAGVLAQDREFVAAVRDGRAVTCDAAVAVAALAVLQQVYDQTVAREGTERYSRPWQG